MHFVHLQMASIKISSYKCCFEKPFGHFIIRRTRKYDHWLYAKHKHYSSYSIHNCSPSAADIDHAYVKHKHKIIMTVDFGYQIYNTLHPRKAIRYHSKQLLVTSQ